GVVGGGVGQRGAGHGGRQRRGVVSDNQVDDERLAVGQIAAVGDVEGEGDAGGGAGLQRIDRAGIGEEAVGPGRAVEIERAVGRRLRLVEAELRIVGGLAGDRIGGGVAGVAVGRFPYTTLFRSGVVGGGVGQRGAG